jgi:hypothetical protein
MSEEIMRSKIERGGREERGRERERDRGVKT